MTGTALIGDVAAPGLHVMTFNIRRRITPTARAADRWARRAPLLRTFLRDERPALLGVQEAMARQADAISGALGARWRFVGHGRNSDGRGEGCPLFFDTERLELCAWSQSALSDRPGVAGSRTWGNRIPRMFVRAELRDRRTGAEFVAVNTHFDPFSARSRLRSARAIRDLVREETRPVVVMGDLNSLPESRPLQELFRGDDLRDAWHVAADRLTPEWGTFGNYRAPRENARRIDWIAVSAEVRVSSIAINTRTLDGGWPSDHFPVQSVMEFPRTADARKGVAP